MTPPALSPEKWPLSKVPVEMDTFSMITMLLRAAVTLRHRNDDLTLWAFRPTHSSSYMSCSDSDFEADFTTLEAFNGLLTPSDGVVAACYRDEKPLVVRDKEECTVDNPVLGSDNQKHMMPCHVVVMANADKQTNALEPNSNPLNLRFLTDGEDLWWKIKESQAGNYDPLDLIARGETVSLGSHAKTVCSYLNEFKAASSDSREISTGNNQMGFGRKFFNYLLSFCWEKLHRRFTSWAGLGFTERLELTWAELESSDAINEYSQWDSFNIPYTGDKSLARFLKKHNFIPTVLDAILVRSQAIFDRGAESMIPPFSSLIGAIQAEEPALFTKNTAKDFHRLVLGTFIMLTAELEQFKTHYRTWKQLDADVRDTAMQSFRRIGLYTRLLLNILASTSFRAYVMFMAQRGVKNLVPVFKNRLSYYAKWKLRQKVLMCRSSEVTAEPSPEADDLEALPRHEDDIEVVIRWIRGFLLQFVGKRHLEQKCTEMHTYFPESSVEIAVMTTDRVHYRIPPWSKFKSLIHDALQACPDRPEDYNTSFVVEMLSQEFAKERQAGYFRSIVYINYFRKLILNELDGKAKLTLTVPLVVHCEAALVVLSMFAEAFRESKDMATLKLNSSMVAVSKLCCPVCWELLTLLRITGTIDSESPKFAIRGSHPHIYPLVLPPYISDEIRQEMNMRFLGYLGTELIQLISGARGPSGAEETSKFSKFRHRRQASDCSTFSQESCTTLCSVSSNSEGEFEDGEDYYPSGTRRGKSELTSFLTDVFETWKVAARSFGNRLRE